MSKRSLLTRAATRIIGGPAADLEDELSGYLRQQDRLAAKLAAVSTAQTEAAEARRRLHLDEGADPAELKRAEERIRALGDEAAGIEDALRHLADSAADVRSRIALRDDGKLREQVAAELEARAQRLMKAAVDLDRAAEKFDAASKNFKTVFLQDQPGLSSESGLSIGIVMGGAYRLAGFWPFSDTDRLMGRSASAYGEAHATCEALKARAEAVRTGSASAALPEAVEGSSAPARVSIPDVAVVLSRPISYSAANGSAQHILTGGVMLPQPVADAAREAGVAFDPDSADGRTIQRIAATTAAGVILKRHNGAWAIDKGDPREPDGKPVAKEPYLFLDADLSGWIEAERARLQAAA